MTSGLESRIRRKAAFVAWALALGALAIGCADVFGLSGYSFDPVEDGGFIDAPVATIDSTVPDVVVPPEAAPDVDAPGPTCVDQIANGSETDVDCGGSCPNKCTSRGRCLENTDCREGLACLDRVCLAPSANDGVRNGTETDIDCGGPDAPACGTGRTCMVAAQDCESRVCTTNVCQAAAPNDNVQNGTETDVDCGGSSAPRCEAGEHCLDGLRDCTSFVCTNLVCRPPTTVDGFQNGSETDVDCGGGNGAPLCIVGQKCVQGLRDCASSVCGSASTCAAAVPSDGVKNGNETDIDCGGGSAPACLDGKTCAVGARDCASKVCTGNVCQAPTTNDGVKNGTETDVDCGGGNGAPRCLDGKACAVGARDCSSLVCGAAGSCLAPTTNDGVKNGSETDVDCGGSAAAPACGTNLVCAVGLRDCISKVCTGNLCQAPTTNDGVRNGNETDVDCGGGNGAPRCDDGLGCMLAGRDCTSRVCTNNICQVPTTNDGVRNGTETDVDCGGGNGAPRCDDGLTCNNGPRDCTSRICTDNLCAIPTTDDGVKNGNETDIDCGGGNGAPVCADGQACVDGPRDCSSGNCVALICEAML